MPSKASPVVTKPALKSVPGRRTKASSTGCLRIFFAVFFFIGIAIIYGTTVRPVIQWLDMRKWEATPCVIDMSGVGYHTSRRDQRDITYSVEAIFHYTYQGRAYKSSTYHIDTGSTSGRAAKQRIVDQIPPGTHTTCYVNPANPAEAVIYRGLSPVVAFGTMGLIFLLIGGAGIYFAPVLSNTAPQHHAVPQAPPVTDEPVALKPQMTPLGKFLFFLFFALFWNGLVGILFYHVFLSTTPSQAVPSSSKSSSASSPSSAS